MATRYDLIGERKRSSFRRKKKQKKNISLAMAVRGFAILLMLNAGLALAIYAGNPQSLYLPTDPLSRVGIRTNMCGKVFVFVPEAWETSAVCLFSNLVPFLVMPGIVLIFILGRLCRGRY